MCASNGRSWSWLLGALCCGVLFAAPAAVALADKTPQTGKPTQRDENQSIHLQGKGRQASEFFTLEPGLAIIDVTHDGTSNYVVRLLDRDGNALDTLVNEIGTYQGQKGFAVKKPGEYLLEVAADGNWTANFRQPRPTEGQTLPRSLSGTGSRATPFLQLNSGLVVFKMNHQGDSRFRVNLLDRDGHLVEEIVNELGEFQGSKPIQVRKPGIYFLNVYGNGDWTVDLQ